MPNSFVMEVLYERLANSEKEPTDDIERECCGLRRE